MQSSHSWKGIYYWPLDLGWFGTCAQLQPATASLSSFAKEAILPSARVPALMKLLQTHSPAQVFTVPNSADRLGPRRPRNTPCQVAHMSHTMTSIPIFWGQLELARTSWERALYRPKLDSCRMSLCFFSPGGPGDLRETCWESACWMNSHPLCRRLLQLSP